MLHATLISGSEELLLVDETGLARIFSLVTEQFRFVQCHLCGCTTDRIHIVLLLAGWTTSLLLFVPFQVVQRSSLWSRKAMNHRVFSAITLPRLALQLQFLLNCQRSSTSVPIWRFLVWDRQKALTQYSWTAPQESAHRSRCTSQARPANTTFEHEGIARTLLEIIRFTTPLLIATQMFGRGILFRLPFIERLHQGRGIAHIPSRSYLQAHRKASPGILLRSFVTLGKKRVNQLANSRTSLWPPSYPSIRHHPTFQYLNSNLATG